MITMFKGLLEKFIPSNKPNVVDFSSIVTDMHSHLIPAIDDGVQSIDESIELIVELKSMGFKKLITTPHIMTDSYNNTQEIIREGFNKVKEQIQKEGIEIELDYAAEYYVDEYFERKIGKEKFLTIGDNYLLIETSYINQPENLKEIIFRLLAEKYKPILAHPERYAYMFDRFDKYKELKETGVLFQLNLNSVTGVYSPIVKIIAKKLIDLGMIDLVGTDVHNKQHTFTLKKCLNEKSCQKLLSLPSKLLNSKL